MSNIYYAEDALTTVYIMNWCRSEGVHIMNPHERYFGRKPDLSHLNIFNSITYVHIPIENSQKLDPKSKMLILVGSSLE